MNIVELLDLLNTATGTLWRDAYDELLDAGYSWQWTASDNHFHLIDLSDCF